MQDEGRRDVPRPSEERYSSTPVLADQLALFCPECGHEGDAALGSLCLVCAAVAARTPPILQYRAELDPRVYRSPGP